MVDPVQNGTSTETFRIIRTSLYTIIGAIIIFGNFFVLAILPKVRMQSSFAKYYLYSLTVADLCTGLFLGIPLLVTSALDRWIFGNVMCAAGAFVRVFFNIAALLSLFAVTIDRFLAIAYPLRYPIFMNQKKGICVLILIWTTASFCSFLYGPMLHRNPVYQPQFGFCLFTISKPDVSDYSIVICLTIFALFPFLATFILYARIYCITKKHTEFTSKFVSHESHQISRNVKFIKTFTLVIFCFGLAWLPTVFIRYVRQLGGVEVPAQVLFAAECLILSNSGINVFIYFWRNKEFKKAATRAICFSSGKPIRREMFSIGSNRTSHPSI